jgi:type I pantothenate kinase
VTRYAEFDRPEWAARRRGSPSWSSPRSAGLVTNADLFEVYEPLAELLTERAGATRPFVVAVTGSVAVGKSAAAAALATVLHAGPAPDAREVSVVCTDGFLFPNRVLAARGLDDRKGFPESFDHDALAAFVRDVRAGATDARAPVYSHAIYDVVDGETQLVGRPEVLVLEGLPFPEEHVDFTVYLDADEDDIERWYFERFRSLCVEARTDDTSYFRPLAGLSDDQLADFAHRVWIAINRVNLEEHILPVRDRSDVILEKGSDHAVRRVRLRIG